QNLAIGLPGNGLHGAPANVVAWIERLVKAPVGIQARNPVSRGVVDVGERATDQDAPVTLECHVRDQGNYVTAQYGHARVETRIQLTVGVQPPESFPGYEHFVIGLDQETPLHSLIEAEGAGRKDGLRREIEIDFAWPL